LETLLISAWRIAQLHSAIFIAIKLPVATGSSWPLPVDEKTNIFIVVNVSFQSFRGWQVQKYPI
jgi:hypothetical protein